MSNKASKPGGKKSDSGSRSKRSSSSSSSSRTAQGSLLGLIVVLVGVIIAFFTGTNPFAPAAPVTDSPVTVTAVPATVQTAASGNVQTILVDKGFGAKKGFWEVYFTAPLNTVDRKQFVGGTDVPMAKALDAVKSTLDIAGFEWDNEVLTQAVLNAVERGVTVRMVADNEHTLEDDDSTILELDAAGVPIVYDERSAFMHNKFMIIDSAIVWTGSTNWTMNGVYRNNNNLLMLRSQRAVQAYQAEFNEMFSDKKFGPRSTKGNNASFNQDGTSIAIYFASEDDVITPVIGEITGAKKSVRFMAFSFTLDSLADAMLARSQAGVKVEGVFEKTGSETASSELTPLFCAGLDVRQDGYAGVMHHKVVIVDDTTVITGSFNFSDNATSSNDENLVIIKDADLAKQYTDEFLRVQAIATRPTGLTCD